MIQKIVLPIALVLGVTALLAQTTNLATPGVPVQHIDPRGQAVAVARQLTGNEISAHLAGKAFPVTFRMASTGVVDGYYRFDFDGTWYWNYSNPQTSNHTPSGKGKWLVLQDRLVLHQPYETPRGGSLVGLTNEAKLVFMNTSGNIHLIEK